jgi:hypothetical protein
MESCMLYAEILPDLGGYGAGQLVGRIPLEDHDVSDVDYLDYD